MTDKPRYVMLNDDQRAALAQSAARDEPLPEAHFVGERDLAIEVGAWREWLEGRNTIGNRGECKEKS